MAIALGGVLALSPAANADVYTVTTTNDPGRGSLRSAINQANAHAGADEIRFAIPGTDVKTITPTGQLPFVTDAVLIDGYSQPGASANTLAVGSNAKLRIVLRGGGVAPGQSGQEKVGLGVVSEGSTIRGLVVGGFETGIGLVSGNRIRGSFLGPNAGGTAANRPNRHGVLLADSRNTVGGTTPQQRNVISGNTDDGVLVESDGSDNEILGNYLGPNDQGTADLGNGDDGIELLSRAANNTIGGTAGGARNVISGNRFGVKIDGPSGAGGNQILGNFIGTAANGTAALGNDVTGVDISDADDNTVGGTASGAGNRIAHNETGVGVRTGEDNRILSNVIFANDGLGIDLGVNSGLTLDGVTANDTDDPDTGGNARQNFPVISSAQRSNTSGFTTISGTLNSNPSQTYTIQCFVAAPDPSNHGEGQIPVGTTTATTNSGGDGSFTCPPNPVPQVGQFVTATATHSSGDTSEFAQNVGVTAVP